MSLARSAKWGRNVLVQSCCKKRRLKTSSTGARKLSELRLHHLSDERLYQLEMQFSLRLRTKRLRNAHRPTIIDETTVSKTEELQHHQLPATAKSAPDSVFKALTPSFLNLLFSRCQGFAFFPFSDSAPNSSFFGLTCSPGIATVLASRRRSSRGSPKKCRFNCRAQVHSQSTETARLEMNC